MTLNDYHVAIDRRPARKLAYDDMMDEVRYGFEQTNARHIEIDREPVPVPGPVSVPLLIPVSWRIDPPDPQPEQEPEPEPAS